MPLYVCRTWEGEVTARRGQELTWVRAKRLADYAMPPAKRHEITIRADVGVGSASATVWTCDLTHDYVSINADYRS